MPWSLKSPWNDDNIATLTRLWADGFSAGCIAAEIGGFTRSAIIGKVHRLGLGGRKTIRVREGGVDRGVFGTSHDRPARKRRASILKKFCGAPEHIVEREAEAAIRSEFYAQEVVELTAEQRAKAVTFSQLNRTTHCKWPYGDPRKPDFVFCGCDRIPDSPYCAPHTRIARPGSRANA